MTKVPSDGLGDGTEVHKTTIDFDLNLLTQQEAHDYRRDLIHAVLYPGTDYDANSNQGLVDEAAYMSRINQVDDYLKTFDTVI